MPTRINIILLHSAACEPNTADTKSYLNSPIKNQLIPPIKSIIDAIKFATFISAPPKKYYIQLEGFYNDNYLAIFT